MHFSSFNHQGKVMINVEGGIIIAVFKVFDEIHRGNSSFLLFVYNMVYTFFLHFCRMSGPSVLLLFSILHSLHCNLVYYLM